MLKKYIYLLFVLTAYLLLLGHNIIPHHHGDEHAVRHHHNHDDSGLYQQHSHHHHDEDEESKNNLINFFSHLVHASGDFSFSVSHSFSSNLLKQSVVAILPDNFILKEIDIPPLISSPPEEYIHYLSPTNHFVGLRAPPVL